MSFKDLKKQSSLGSLTQKLVKEVEKMNTTGGSGDDRLWKPEVDKTGNGYAVIRFLPAPEGEDIPWAKIYSHAFQGPGGWYIENSLTSVGKKDQQYHIEILERLLEKQKVMYTRLSLSEDPEAKVMKDSILQSAISMGLPSNVDVNTMFNQMSKMVEMMKGQLDLN